ncbi:carbon-phosphorus lyase complex subunit PhnI [Anaerosporobacter sp.]|uniref:carbon-phosphorus lyase complex subunit PhnI n=1 Tax=Anaerosporobacter sp. TaxID=1872529 RepID=UPI00286F1EC6|nr:carbon-phosphorus lyase complex subunit PhnI [Anaerosporobacter sp.]
MGYVAVTGGSEAIDASIELLKQYRSNGEQALEIEVIKNRMALLIDRVMSEAGLYAPDYAALALKQCEGSQEEAVFLLRAYRSTLQRNYTSRTISSEEMHIRRRISSAFKDIPGGQQLGPTYDYVHRLLNFDLLTEKEEEVQQWKESFERQGDNDREEGTAVELSDTAPRVLDLLREEGLIEQVEEDASEPCDITMEKLPLPAPRSAILQTLTRADTGYVSGLAYSDIRGFGASHPTIGELRYGKIEVEIDYPLEDGEEWYVGDIYVTEVEGLMGEKPDKKGIGVGYGCVIGRNDTKAIAMAVLDNALRLSLDSPTSDMEFVLLHGDCLEMNGFISHLKLPHYVTFQSKLDSLRSRKKKEESNV